MMMRNDVLRPPGARLPALGHLAFQDAAVSRAARAGLVGGVVVAIGFLAVAMHRTGHTQGDDFALYLRQARSIFDGDVAAVVADNRFSVINSGQRFSPTAYPWGWPLMLSPFVWRWGLDYDRLKLVEVVTFCIWLVLLHGIVRRRIGRLAALAVVLVIGTAPAYLGHTDELLSEFPYFMMIGLVIWWYDRIRDRSDLLTASTRDLVVLGMLAAAAFNVRREGIVLVGVIAAVQLYDLLRPRRDESSSGGVLQRVRRSGPALLTPHAALIGAVVTFQLLLPAMLLPGGHGGSREEGTLRDRLGELPAHLTDQLELGQRPLVGVVFIAVAAVGAAIGVRRHAGLDLPLAVLALLTVLSIGTRSNDVGRYWLQVTPWVIYFVTVALTTLGALLFRRHRALGAGLALAPLAVLIGAHSFLLVGDIGDARRFDADGRTQWGPTHPAVVPVYDAVLEYTPPGATIAFYRARTMTLLTDRRAVQTKTLSRVIRTADYFAQRRNSDYAQSDVEPAEAREMGMVEVWSDETWILWKLPESPLDQGP